MDWGAILNALAGTCLAALVFGYVRLWLKVTRLETCVNEREKPLAASMDRLSENIDQLNEDIKKMFRALGRVEAGK
jgi:hypothetical protein